LCLIVCCLFDEGFKGAQRKTGIKVIAISNSALVHSSIQAEIFRTTGILMVHTNTDSIYKELFPLLLKYNAVLSFLICNNIENKYAIKLFLFYEK
jgi:hypothetical protein